MNNKGPISNFITHHYRHFNAAALVDAAKGYETHLLEGGKMMVTLAGAMSTAELGISLAEMKWLWFFPYLFLVLMSHHLLLFTLEAGDWTLIGYSVLKALSSTLLGMAVFGILEFFNRAE